MARADAVMARPAEPLLASSLVEDGELEALFDELLGGKKVTGGGDERLATGVRSLDDALGGGLEAGAVVGVSCEGGGGGAVSLSIRFDDQFDLSCWSSEVEE
jgi:hypothetical protein